MSWSRRELCLWLPALMALPAQAAEESGLPSKVYHFDDLPVRTAGDNRFRHILEGTTGQGFRIEMHESDLAPGGMPHPAHRHAHDEVFMVREGTLEITIAGRSSRLGPGAVAYVASNEDHGVRNPGTTHVQYFVLALGR